MAFKHGKDAEVKLAGTALSTFCDSADLDVKVDTSDTTTFGAAWKTALTGLIGANVNINGDYDPTAVTGPQAVILALIGADPFACEFYPGGNVSGQGKRAFSAILTGYKETSKTSEKVIFSVTLLVTGAVTFTVV